MLPAGPVLIALAPARRRRSTRISGTETFRCFFLNPKLSTGHLNAKRSLDLNGALFRPLLQRKGPRVGAGGSPLSLKGEN